MGADKNKPDEESIRHRLRLTTRELQRRAECKRRYGRASLTIRRWGGLGELIGDSNLAKTIDAFRAGEASAEDVAWAFVRARVKSHSPTFRWKNADLERLIGLVADCSESPPLEETTADELADALVKAQDAERESMKRLAGQLSRTFASINKLPTALAISGFSRWAEQQQRTMDVLSRTLMPRLTDQLAAFQPFRASQQLERLGLSAKARRAIFPTLEPTLLDRLALMPPAALLRQRIRLPDETYPAFAKSLERSIALHRRQTHSPFLLGLARHQSFTVGEVVEAAREAAELVEREGDPEDAAELVALSAEAVEVMESPSTATLERMVAELSERIDERFDELEQRDEAREERHQKERRDDIVLNLFLWFLSIYLALFVTLLENLPKE